MIENEENLHIFVTRASERESPLLIKFTTPTEVIWQNARTIGLSAKRAGWSCDLRTEMSQSSSYQDVPSNIACITLKPPFMRAPYRSWQGHEKYKTPQYPNISEGLSPAVYFRVSLLFLYSTWWSHDACVCLYVIMFNRIYFEYFAFMTQQQELNRLTINYFLKLWGRADLYSYTPTTTKQQSKNLKMK